MEWRGVAGLIVVVVAGCGSPVAPPSVARRPPPAALEIVRAMGAAYRAAATYTDHGTVTADSARGLATKSFETSFVRSSRFRFELRDENDPRRGLVIWSDGTHAYSRWYGPARTTDDGADLGLALTLATKPSGESAFTIPHLLVPDAVPGLAMTDLAAARVTGSESIDDHPCWIVAGTRGEAAVTLWIDRASHVLRRASLDEHGTTIVTKYAPVLDGALDIAQITPPDFSDDYASGSALAARTNVLLDKPAPALELVRASGTSATTLADLAGHVVILDFWASWCGPCRTSMPHLDGWQRTHGARGLRILGVSSEPADLIARYAVDNALDYTLAHDPNSATSRRYGVMALPMLVVIDKAGIIRHVSLGTGELDRVEALVERLLR